MNILDENRLFFMKVADGEPSFRGAPAKVLLKLVAFRMVGVLFTCVLLSSAGPLLAAVEPLAPSMPADTANATAQNDNITTYDQSYFAEFGTVTAEDMLRRIPGIQDLLGGGFGGGGGGRGFGSTGSPFLFNGRRLSGKSINPIGMLRRIQAPQVLRIEVIRGAVPDLDVRIGDKGRLVNIVLNEAVPTGIGSWEVQSEYITSGKWQTGGTLSYANEVGQLSYILSAEINPHYMIGHTEDLYFLPPDPNPLARIDLKSREFSREYVANVGLTYSFDNGDVANLNGRYARESDTERQPLDRFDILSPGKEAYTSSTLVTKDENGNAEWELGGDYEHAFDNGDSLRMLFVISHNKSPEELNVFRTNASEPEIHSLHQVQNSDGSEKILRGTYNWAVADGHTVQFGAEAALNSLDQVSEQFEESARVLVPVELFNSDSTVKETRLETFASYSWQISPRLYAEVAVDTEFSRLKQEGSDVSTSRAFFFVKPRLDVRYKLDGRTQLRARVLHDISQLDFSEFVSFVRSDIDDLGEIQAGNPELVPEKTWTVEATVERRLGDDLGTASLRGFYKHISDVIDQTLIYPDDSDISGTGNIGSGWVYGAELTAGLRLKWLGLSGASIDVSGTVQDSSVRDPFTLERIPIGGRSWNYFWSVNYRHDTDFYKLSYGASFNGHDAGFRSDVDYTQWSSAQPQGTVFVEKRIAGLNFRVEATGLMRRNSRERLVYSGNRATAGLERLESRDENFYNLIRFTVRGTF